MRSEIRRYGGVIYLYDCYNANPASVKAALDVLVELDPVRRTIAVLGDMLELGPKEKQFHQEIGHYAAQKKVHHVIACGAFGPMMQKGAWTVRRNMPVTVVKDAVEAGECVKAMVKRGDIVLIKASRGAQMERVFEANSRYRKEVLVGRHSVCCTFGCILFITSMRFLTSFATSVFA